MRLESISPCRDAHCGCGTCVGLLTRHGPREVLNRHRHDEPFAAIVISGTYVEAGDTGRHRIGPGDVLVHAPFESHLNRFDTAPTEVLNLPLGLSWNGPVLGTINDPDSIARAAERDVGEAAAILRTEIVEKTSDNEDWTDVLAAELLRDPDLSLRKWADQEGFHLGSISRGFRQQFGITPARFRLMARTHRAISRISKMKISEAAMDCGFADQAHFSRASKQFTGLSPLRLKQWLSGGVEGGDRTAC